MRVRQVQLKLFQTALANLQYQALEDAVFLAEILREAIKDSVSAVKAFEVYDVIRRPRTQLVVSTSKESGDVLSMRGPPGSNADLLREDFLTRRDWIWEYDVEQGVKNALVRLSDEHVDETEAES